MATTYEECPKTVQTFASDVLREYHPNLYAAEVEIQYAFAMNAKDWPLKVRGQRVAGKVKIVNLEDRARGGPDAKITLDKGWWDEHDDAERRALLDHEHEHLLLTKMRTDEEGALKFDTDDVGRPKLKMKNHDAECGVFFSVMERHQEKSVDFRVVQTIAKQARKLVQQEFFK